MNGPGQRIDTRVYFDIMQEDGETILLFKHCGWREEEEIEFMHHGTSWATCLIVLRNCLMAAREDHLDRATVVSAGGLNRL